MLSWGPKKLTSGGELKQVQMSVITEPTGPLGRLFGRALRFRVGRFAYVMDAKGTALQRVEVESDSLVPECEVRRAQVTSGSTIGGLAQYRYEERVPLTISESTKLVRRVRDNVLDVARYPYIHFDVEGEDAESISGTLHMHGDSHHIRCTKSVEGTELAVRCPVSLKQFSVPPFSLWLGMFSVADTVLIETRVPSSALKL